MAYSRIANYGSRLDGPPAIVEAETKTPVTVGAAALETFEHCRIGVEPASRLPPKRPEILEMWKVVDANSWTAFEWRVRSLTVEDYGTHLSVVPARNGGPHIGFTDIPSRTIRVTSRARTVLGKAILEGLCRSKWRGEN